MATLGAQADPETQDVRVDGNPLPSPQRRLYFALNKPKGYTSTKRDPHASHTVLELLGDVGPRVYPVGRLDVDSEGLLLLTNDGDFAYHLTHPRHRVPKVYEVTVRGAVDRQALRALREGIDLSDGRTAPAEARVLEMTPGLRGKPATTKLEVVLHEGRKRQVRRMCAAVGFPVLELVRVRVGPVSLGHLKPGRFRALSESEVRALLRAAGADAEPAPQDATSGGRERAPGAARSAGQTGPGLRAKPRAAGGRGRRLSRPRQGPAAP